MTLGAEDRRAAILYYKDRTITSRLQTVDALAQYAIANDALKNEWSALRHRINELLPVRNIFVHHPALRTGTSDGKQPVFVYSIHIEPNERRLGKTLKALKGKSGLDLSDFEQHGTSLDQLEQDLRKFITKLILPAPILPTP